MTITEALGSLDAALVARFSAIETELARLGAIIATPPPPPPPTIFKGYLDSVDGGLVAGWCTAPVSVYMDGVHIADVMPDQVRTDVVAAFPTYPLITGFSHQLTAGPGLHQARVVMSNGVEIGGSPRTFTIQAAPILAWDPSFTGASLAVGESLNLNSYITNGPATTFTLNPLSASLAGQLTLAPDGILTRIGPDEVSGIIIDAEK